MRHLRIIITAAALTALPLASSFAGNGSDVAPQTQGAAVQGANPSSAAPTGMTTNGKNGMTGGGMVTANGTKAGGMSKENPIMSTGAPQTTN